MGVLCHVSCPYQINLHHPPVRILAEAKLIPIITNHCLRMREAVFSQFGAVFQESGIPQLIDHIIELRLKLICF